MSVEKWLSVVGFESYYDVSSIGRVKSLRSGEILSEYIDRDGYSIVSLSVKGVKKKRRSHRLVLEAFECVCPKGMQCSHIDGNPANNILSNLKWTTPSNNNKMKLLHGTHDRGEASKNSKLKESQVREIMDLLNKGDMSHQKISELFPVSRTTISSISAGVNWSWLNA